MAESEQREINEKGRIEASDELCGDGSEALVFITEDDDEYVIRNKKVVRRLKKYAYLDDVQITIHGLVKRSTDGIDVLGVLGYSVPKNKSEQEQLPVLPDISLADETGVYDDSKLDDGMLLGDEGELEQFVEADKPVKAARKGGRRR